MTNSLSDWITLRQLTGGRRELVFKQVSELAGASSLGDLAKVCSDGVEHEQDLRNRRRTYLSAKARPMPPRLTELDPIIDKTIGAIYRNALEAAETLQSEPAGEHGRKIVKAAFPTGAKRITSMAYVEQVSEVDSVVKLLEATELAGAIEALGLMPYVNQLEATNAEFRTILEQEPKGGVTFDELRAKNAAGQETVLHMVAMILGAYPGPSEDDIEHRTRLLAPIRKQDDAVGAYHRARRAVRDVDPDTGEEVDEPSEPEWHAAAHEDEDEDE